MDDLPAEILATAFEMGVLAWGVHFLPPVCLVCRTWNDIVANTPHLWGIVAVEAKSRPRLLLDQISKAKATPLTIFLGRGAHNRDHLQPVIDELVQLSCNWVSAVVPAHILKRCRWYDLRSRLQELSITQGSLEEDSIFFKIDEQDDLCFPPALRRLSMSGPSPPSQLLSTSLRHFNFVPGRSYNIPLSTTLDQLSRVTKIETLEISLLKHLPRLPDQSRTIQLNNLTSLTLSAVDFPSLLLCSLACPALEVLTLRPGPWRERYWWGDRRDVSSRSLTPFLSQWCDIKHTPTRLHTLTIEQCLTNGDVPYLIRFLARLPNIVRLTIHDDAVSKELAEHTNENDLLKALASPRQYGGCGWMCPLLGYLNIQPDVHFGDILAVAQGRGIRSTVPGGPRTLRKVTGYLCRDGTEEEMNLFKGLVEDVECECLACGIGFVSLA